MPLLKKVKCAECGALMELKTTTRFTYNNGNPRKFYGCTNFPKCKGTHGAHPDGTPFGTPGDDRTKRARRQAHAVFDHWWRTRGVARGMAYKKLEEVMGLEKGQAHIGSFTAEQCIQVSKIFTKLCMIPPDVPPAVGDEDRVGPAPDESETTHGDADCPSAGASCDR